MEAALAELYSRFTSPWLLVIDNVEEKDVLKYLPANLSADDIKPHVIITSRKRERREIPEIRLNVLTRVAH